MTRDQLPAPKTFIGPITVEKTGGKITSASFHVLQSTSGIIKLDYPDKPTAVQARNQLLRNRYVYKVGSNPLLEAIRAAISEAIIASKQVSESGTETGDKDPQ